MPWLMVNQTRLVSASAVPTPLLALDVHRDRIPGDPGASTIVSFPCQVAFRHYARDARSSPGQLRSRRGGNASPTAGAVKLIQLVPRTKAVCHLCHARERGH